jgi:hypothetical protein
MELLLSLGAVMTAPTFRNWVTVLGGWLFSPRRTVTGMLIAANVAGKRHHSAYHRVFAEAVWSMDLLGLAILRLALALHPKGRPIFVSLDDTLARKRGRRIFGVGMHHDPLLSSRKNAVLNRGHSWVVLGVVLELPFAKGLAYSLPFFVRLYRNKKTKQFGGRYRTRPELAVVMLKKLAEAFPGPRFHVLADSAYSGRSVVAHLPERFDLTGRIHFDAKVFAEPTPRKDGGPGRPRKRGDRLPSPREMLAQYKGKVVELDIYGRREKARIVTQDALWYGTAGSRPVRIVAVEPLTGGRKPQAFYSTDLTAEPTEILRRYALRWSLEVTFHDSKQCLGFEQPQGWTRKAVLRTGPMAMLLYSLIVIWFAKRPRKDRVAVPKRPWYTLRRRASFADMLATLKRECVEEEVSSSHPHGLHLPNSVKTLLVHCAGAA